MMKAGETLKSRGVPMKNKTKRKNRIFRVLLATMLILFGVSFRNDGKIGISGVQSVQAVSYTHLDVYKRQNWMKIK